jgi:hypothetical protein
VDKPKPKTMKYWDYSECRNYVELKYGFTERDYAGRFTPKSNPEAPYQDFWHFVVDRAPIRTNGQFFTMHDEWKDGAEPWQQEIIEKYLIEFGKEVDGQREAEFYAGW